jgi:hypothetical protein
MNTLRQLIFIISILYSGACFSMKLPEILSNKIYSENIRTVQFYGEEGSLSNPVISLNSDQKLHFTFDDLSDGVKDYYFTIFHCDRNWRLSKITQQEYLKSFVDFPLNDFAFSVNTYVRYVNYSLELPSNDVPFYYSGNYILVVFDRDNPELPIITWRFFVVERLTNIEARIKQGTFDQGNNSGETQEVDFQIRHKNFPIKNPRTDLKVIISQNNRSDNELSGFDPTFSGDGVLRYDYNRENIFFGDNEYRSFETRSLSFPGKGVDHISFHRPFYHIILEQDQLRVQERYSYDRELNGRYRVEIYNSEYPEVEADYLLVHFNLKMEQVLAGGGVYVFGAMTNWQCTPHNEMTWNMDKKQYELSILLKQGYYNYCYAWKDLSDNIIQINALEGSHFETENDYFIYVYYGSLTDKFDRLVGYQKFNSLKDRSFLNNFD